MANKKTTVINEYHLNRYQPAKPQLALHDLNTYIKKHAADTTQPHIHSYYQVIWFQRGKGKHFVDFKEYAVFDNTIFFIAQNQVHYFDNHINYEGILIHFNESFLIQNSNESDFLLKGDLFGNLHPSSPCCSGSGMNDLLDDYINLMKKEMEAEIIFGKEELLRIYLKAFLIQLQRRKSEEGKKQPALMDEKKMLLVRFINLIDDNYNKGITVSEYAKMLFVSARTLSYLTRQALNKTPSQMVQERIILEAQRLLLYSGLNVNQIAYRLGFEDPSYFVKYFKKHTYIAPSEFRSQFLKSTMAFPV